MAAEISRERTPWAIAVVTVAVVVALCFAVGEIMVRYLHPQISQYPRQSASDAYGIINYPSRRIIHDVPGRWHFEYSTNRFGHRGAGPVISNQYGKPNVVVLGDSFTFGMGVNDGEEYPAVMQRRFGDRARVVILGMPGWGLTQQIRQYYELGQVCQPRAVVLTFCSNDPVDNERYPVTTVENGAFVFHPAHTEFGAMKRMLSTSWLQKSQLYNFVRSSLYELARDREVFPEFANSASKDTAPSARERTYVDLLETFARDLNSRGVPLVMIAVNGQLKEYPHIAQQANAFTAAGGSAFAGLFALTL